MTKGHAMSGADEGWVEVKDGQRPDGIDHREVLSALWYEERHRVDYCHYDRVWVGQIKPDRWASIKALRLAPEPVNAGKDAPAPACERCGVTSRPSFVRSGWWCDYCDAAVHATPRREDQQESVGNSRLKASARAPDQIERQFLRKSTDSRPRRPLRHDWSRLFDGPGREGTIHQPLPLNALIRRD